MACPSCIAMIRFRNCYTASHPEHPFIGDIVDNPVLRERRFVFSDRHEAGKQLGVLISALRETRDPVVLAIPSGSIPVGKEAGLVLGSPLDLAIVRKIQIPGYIEAGFGAVTWGGKVLINERLCATLKLS